MMKYLMLLILHIFLTPCIHAEPAGESRNTTHPQRNNAAQVSESDTDRKEMGKPSRSMNIAPIPIVYYTPESSLTVGGSAVLTFRDPEEMESQRPDSLQLIAAYTLKHQSFFSIIPNYFFNDAKGNLKVSLSYAKWPTSFFGIGNDSNISSQDIDELEETYTSESATIQPWISHKVFSDFAVGVTFDLKQNMISDTESSGQIEQGDVTGADGGLRSGIGPVFSWDTRNHLFYPTGGSWYKLWSWHYRDTLGSDFNYDYYALDLRGYRSFPNGHVLAYQGLGIATDGKVPFNELPTPLIRGLYQDVFVEKNLLNLQLEYRFPIKNRWSGVTFLAAGDVFRDGGNYDINDIKYGGGGGIRYAVSSKEKINLRFDVGVSRYGVFPYVMFQEAF
jgi:hypothetical protein